MSAYVLYLKMNKVGNNQRRQAYVINNTTFKNLPSLLPRGFSRISLTLKLQIYCVLKLKEIQFRKYKRSRNIPQNQGHSKRRKILTLISLPCSVRNWKKQSSALHCGAHKINHNSFFLWSLRDHNPLHFARKLSQGPISIFLCRLELLPCSVASGSLAAAAITNRF